MTALKTLIVDDEAPARSKIKRYLRDDTRIDLIGDAADGPSALQMINAHQPQLLLLDIQMPEVNGFDVLRLLPGTCKPAVIFITAYDEYAIQAFEVSAADYLLKPFGKQRLADAITKVIARLQGAENNTIQTVLGELKSDAYTRRLPVQFMKRVHLLDVNDISHIVSEHRLIHVYDRQRARYWTNETLDSLEKRLDPQQFFRIHRSSLINLAVDFEIEPWVDGRLRLHLSEDTVLTVARDPAKVLKSRLGL